jgi:Uma2 family endonuclease
MTTIVGEVETVTIPSWVKHLSSFRRWLRSDEFPEKLRICFFNGGVWVDMSKEQVFSHNQVKNEFAFVLTGLVKAGRLGRYFPDGLMESNDEVGFASVPDGTFVSNEALQEERVHLLEAAKEGCIELAGTPDMVLEVVSRSSVRKDTDELRELYWQAGIPEYWLVDARGERLEFNLLRHTAKGYVAARKQGGWVKSNVFGKSFRLTRQPDELGNPEFTLAVR